MVYRLSFSLLRNKTQSFYNSLILATSFYIIFAGRNGTWDIFAHALMMLGIYFLWKFFRQENSNYTNALLAGLGIGLSFLSKGPVIVKRAYVAVGPSGSFLIGDAAHPAGIVNKPIRQPPSANEHCSYD